MTKSKVATLEKHRFLCLVVALALVAATVMSLVVPRVVRADDSEGITCNFTIGNQGPVITEVGLYNDAENQTVDEMTPQLEYAIKVTVADNNTLDDLDKIIVTIFLDQDGDDTDNESERVPHTQKAFKMTCTVGGANGTWSGQPATGTTWSIVTDNCVQPSLSLPSGNFWFHFKPGKVATEATQGTAWNWDIYVEVKDEGGLSDTEYHMGNYEMMWYGEIDVVTTGVAWSGVEPGMDFSHESAKKPVSVRYISNGEYDAAVAASDNWSGATLNPVGTPGPQQFSLKAWSSDNLSAAKLVTTNPNACVIVPDGSRTEESGALYDNNHVYLKLGTPFVDGTYSGTITFYIRERG